VAERVLFVDDDLAGRELSLFNLSEAGYAVDTARDGQEALALFSPEAHQLVITDLRMPRLSGMELVAELRRRAPDVPIIVITAHGSIETAVAAMRAGAYDFLQKPFGRDELLLAAGRALERWRDPPHLLLPLEVGPAPRGRDTGERRLDPEPRLVEVRVPLERPREDRLEPRLPRQRRVVDPRRAGRRRPQRAEGLGVAGLGPVAHAGGERYEPGE
jgi:DNA-binding response OmpR family regulator